MYENVESEVFFSKYGSDNFKFFYDKVSQLAPIFFKTLIANIMSQPLYVPKYL